MATDSDVPEAGKADAMEADTETEVVAEKQRLRLVNLPSASTNCGEIMQTENDLLIMHDSKN
jgi:hypothetical protein